MHTKKSLIISICPIIAVAIYPVFFLYITNIGEAHLSQVLLPLAIMLLIAVLLELLFVAIFKDLFSAALTTILTILIIQNFSLIESTLAAMLPMIKYWHALTLCLLFIVFFSCLVGRFTSEIKEAIVCDLGIVFAFLIIFNIAISAPNIIRKMKAYSSNRAYPESISSVHTSDNLLPNLYYIILDEYSNFNILEKYYNFDNKDFQQFLLENGFQISWESKNESFDTSTVTTNIMNLDYVVTDKQTISEKILYRTEPMLWRLLEENGYDIKVINQNYDVIWKSQTYNANTPFGPDIQIESNIISDEFFNAFLLNTVFYPYVNSGSSAPQREIILQEFTALTEFGMENNHTAVLAHIRFPHEPFVFDSNGGSVPTSEMTNWSDKSYYLNQLIYCNSLMEKVIASLIEKDPEAIIILQSDHSARFALDANGEYFITPNDRKYILNSIRYPNQNIDFQNKSAVNTMRKVLNTLLGTQFEEIEVPVNENYN